MDISAAWIILGTVGVTLLIGLTAVLISTLLELRLATRELRQALERIVPPLEETLQNLRKISTNAARLTEIIEAAAPLAGQLKHFAGKASAWASGVAGAVGLFKFVRFMRGTRKGSSPSYRR